MPPGNLNCPDAPVLILAPIGHDSRNAADVLGKASISTEICESVRDMCTRAGDDSGALLISEEVLDESSLSLLLELLGRQPLWSDIPLILLTASRERRQETFNILNFLGTRANVTLLEKPLRMITLISVVRAALRSRNHQYEVRDLLEGYSRAVTEEQRATAKFRAIFDQSSVFAGIMDLDGNLIEVNRLWLDMCGYRAEEQSGRAFWECGWWRNSKEVQHKVRDGIVQAARGRAYTEILPYVWADDSKHVVEFSLFPIRDDGGNVIFLHPTGIDITERQLTLARTDFLGQLTQKLSIVSDAMDMNRIATREIGNFLGVDRCFFLQANSHSRHVRILQDWRREKEATVEGTYEIDAFGPPEWWNEVQSGPVEIADVNSHSWTKDFKTAYRSLNIRAYTMVPFIQEGRWVACICAAYKRPFNWTGDEKALLENAVARVWPLIERARAEDALREVNSLLADKAAHLEALVQQRTSKLLETIADLESFSYSIAHDMRAPLRSLQGFSEILMSDHSGKLDLEGQQLLRRIGSSAGRMDKLIQDVLNYSRVMRSDFPLEAVDVEQLLRGIVDTYPAFAPGKAEISIESPFPPVNGNEAMLTQIFSNLMGNAVKFMAPGVLPKIRIWSETAGDRVRIFVEDNGIGIAADQHERIFGIFQRVTKEYDGTGIGLAITKKAAERMGGSVGLKSEPGQGSTFWIDMEKAAGEKSSL